MCVKVECDFKAKSYTISFEGNPQRISCKEGQSFNVNRFTKYFIGDIKCPSFYEVCFSNDVNGVSHHRGDSTFFPSYVNFVYILLAILSFLLVVI